MKTTEKFQGALIGLATGDALGTTVEFLKRGSFEPLTDLIGGSVFRLNAGEWTDDTSMALCLAQSLLDEGFNTFDQMSKYHQWFRRGYMSSVPGTCVDIGISTQNALVKFEECGQPICGLTARDTAGNGSIMRLASVPMLYVNSEAKVLIDKCAVSSKTTHAAPQSVDGCRYMGYLISLALKGASKEKLLSDLTADQVFEQPLDTEILAIAKGSFKEKPMDQIMSSGYVVHTLEAALWVFNATSDFQTGALKAANLGHDADTVCAVYGQIAGAFYGIKSIPQEWVNKIYKKEMILQMADQLYLDAFEVNSYGK